MHLRVEIRFLFLINTVDDVPMIWKMAYMIMNIRRRPYRKVQRSLSDPDRGERKNPSTGANVNTNDMYLEGIPISSRIGPEKAVIAA